MNDINNATRNDLLFEALKDELIEDDILTESEGGTEDCVEKLGGFQTASSLLGSGKEKVLGKDKMLESLENKQGRMSALGTGFQTAASLLKNKNSNIYGCSSQKDYGIKRDQLPDAHLELSNNEPEVFQHDTPNSEHMPQNKLTSPQDSLKSIQLELSDKVKYDLQEIAARFHANNELNSGSGSNENKSILKTYTLTPDNNNFTDTASSKILQISPKANVMKIDFSKWKGSQTEETTVDHETDEPKRIRVSSRDSTESSSKRHLDGEFYRDHQEARKRQKSSNSNCSDQSSSRRKYSDSDIPLEKRKLDKGEIRKQEEAMKMERYRKQREGVADNVIKLLQPLYDKQCIPNKEVFKKTARWVGRHIFMSSSRLCGLLSAREK